MTPGSSSLSDYFLQSRVYVLCINAAGMNLEAFHRYLTDSREIEGFWNYIPLMYFVRTKMLANGLAERIRPFVPSASFVVAEVNPGNVDGRQPAPSWEWFYQARSQPGNTLVAPIPPMPTTKK